MFKKIFCILGIVVLSLNMPLASWAKDSKSKFLPKTKDTKSDDKKSSNEDSKDSMDDKSADDVNDSKGEEQVIDNPDESFKLIAIYLVGNKPRALIKNLDKPEDPAKEFQVGDYVDELQAFSISKILLNPTARIELVDPDGLSYVIKTKNTDSTKTTQPSKSKSLPSYLSGSNKVKIKRATTTTTKPVNDKASPAAPSANEKPSEKKNETTSLESAIKTDTSSQTTTPPPSNPPPAPAAEQPQNTPQQQPASQGIQTTSTGTTQTNTVTVPTAKTDSMMATSGGAVDTSRPSNPFGE